MVLSHSQPPRQLIQSCADRQTDRVCRGDNVASAYCSAGRTAVGPVTGPRRTSPGLRASKTSDLHPYLSAPQHVSPLPTQKFFKTCNDSKVLCSSEPSFEYLSPSKKSVRPAAAPTFLFLPLPKDLKIQGKSTIYNFFLKHRVRKDFESPHLVMDLIP